ncbi:MAG: ABC transporter permease subunit [Rhodobacteraceae bacterium]|nr:MAG: ABC transporter permease subunit [Paracoccaceae bacterium]
MLALLGLWVWSAAALDSDLLPGPLAVLASMGREIVSGGYLFHLAMTLLRVTAAFVLAMSVGAAIGLALGMSRAADRLFSGWLTLFLNLPALVTIILCYVWFGLTEVAAVAAVAINKIPNVAATLREGGRALSKDLAEMAALYAMPAHDRLRHVIAPQLAPFLAVAARNGLALVWKIVLVVELLGRPNGVGFMLYAQFQLFDVAAILAYAFGFIAVVLAVEWTLLEPWERRASRWRR